MPLPDAVALFRPAGIRWWVSGGHALELHLGHSWRTHEDIDIGFMRQDAAAVRDLLAGWEIHLAAGGVLTPWNGEPLSAVSNHNNLWCRRSANSPWSLDLTISEGDESCWIYRRDPTMRVRWADAVLTDHRAIPYLAPELQLLFKAKKHRAKDDLDAATVVPLLDPRRTEFLSSTLPDDHPWHAFLK